MSRVTGDKNRASTACGYHMTQTPSLELVFQKRKARHGRGVGALLNELCHLGEGSLVMGSRALSLALNLFY